ncbi:DUF2213 domain-containing protein [Stenotrophomonas sepilia]|uniref:DUF2213 domain-containing protein n=1 Tax=Stenotrophomonas sepilia TaxID=2860290 RepID=UPI002E75BF5E|nr:DUF2213 domain-containing protein [Stenotrophomonas sepilia]
MFLTDRVPLSAVRRTADGYLVADAFVARTGVQTYLGEELGRPDLLNVRLYRPPEEVFSDATLRSFAHRPMTNDHPPEQVNAQNWKKYAVGQTGDEVVHDQKRVRVPLVLMDQDAIADYEAGKRELSQGYSSEIDWTDGVTPEGEPFDAIQRNIRNNHLAMVRFGRAGHEFRIGDGGAPGAPDPGPHHHQKEPTMSDKTILVDGLSVVTNEAGAQAIGKLQQQLKDAHAAAGNADAAHKAAIDAKDAAIAKIEAERDAVKAKVLSDADLDQRVQQRGDLIAKAKAVHDADYSGKTDAEVRKIAVVAKLGDAAVAGKADAYIEARFDILADEAKPVDPVAQALRDSSTHRQPVKDNGYAASVAGLDYRTAKQKEA